MFKKAMRVLSLGGSIMAFHVGSGFASGQEILQFYTSYGPQRGLCMSVLACVLLVAFSFRLLEAGRQAPEAPVRRQYQRLGGAAVGGVFFWLTPLLMSLVLCVTIAGGGAALAELFGVPAARGKVWMGLPVLVTVLLGLQCITALSGSLGPIIIVCALGLGAFGIARGQENTLWMQLSQPAGSWALAAVSYACFGMVTQVPFLLTVGKELSGPKEALAIALLGNGGYMLTGAALHLGLCKNLPQLLGDQLPALTLARQVSGLAGWFYGVIVLFSIYTTAVPLLWSVCRAIAPQEKSVGYRVSALGLTALACAGARLPFDRLLGLVYPGVGYVSALFFLLVLLRGGRGYGHSGVSRHRAANAA